MQAIEFETVLKNGTVAVPAEYLAQWEGKTIRVLLLDNAASLSAAPKPDSLKGSVTFEGDLLAPIDARWDADL